MKSGRSKKYGFVFFADQESCEKAVTDDKHVIDGQKVLYLVCMLRHSRHVG